MDEEDNEYSGLDAAEDLPEEETEAEVQSPLSSVAPDETRTFLLRQAQRREEERSKLFQAELDRIEAAKKRLLAQPTQLSRQEMLRAIAGRLTQRPTDTRDPRFFERRNLFSTLRDVASVGAEAAEAEKKAKLQQQAGVDELEALRGKYMYGAAEKAAEQARADLARYRPPAAPRLQADAQRIIDLQSIVDDPSRSEEERQAAKRQISAIGQRSTPQDNSTFAQILRAQKIIETSKNPSEVRAATLYLNRYNIKPKNLTVPQARTDEAIRRAKEFLATVTPEERRAAFSNPYPNERQLKIRNSVKLSEQPTYGEIAEQDGFEAVPLEDEEQG